MNKTIDETLLSLIKPRVVDLVRLGRHCDGGYVIAQEALAAATGLVSFGLGADWSFEKAFSRQHPQGLLCVYDHTVSSSFFLKKSVKFFLKGCLFNKKAMGQSVKFLKLYGQYNTFFQGPYMHQLRCLTRQKTSEIDMVPQEVFSQFKPQESLFLKVDIEGCEYEVLGDLVDSWQWIPGLVVEFHEISLKKAQFIALISHLKNRFEIVHVHANNFAKVGKDGVPDALEISFLNKALLAGQPVVYRSTLPLEGLDYPCDALNPDIKMVFP